MECQAIRTAPDHDVAVKQPNTPNPVGARLAAPEEHGRQAQRDRHDRLTKVTLVAVLVKRQARARRVAVDQAGVGTEAVEARRLGSLGGKACERPGIAGQGRPVAGSMAP